MAPTTYAATPRPRGLSCGLAQMIAVTAGFAGAATDASATEGVEWSAVYQGDLVSSWSDVVDGRSRALDSAHFTVDLDMERLFGVSGLSMHADVNSTSGATPTDDALTLQGVDNIEVGRQRTRLYELWGELSGLGGRGSLRFGLQELNAEFYATESSGLLINPSFGLGPEFAATGINGPSTYPSTALALRARFAPSENVELLVGVFNANAASPGDPGGVDTSFDDGVLQIAQLAWRGKVSVFGGVWAYSDRHDDLRDVDSLGDPVKSRSYGGYGAFEYAAWDDENAPRRHTLFIRGGGSEGDTTSFKASVQAGVLVDQLFVDRKDSALSIGVSQARTSRKHRANERDAGVNAAHAETVVEVAYSDRMTSWLTVQPDVQVAFDPAGDRARDTVYTAAIRVTIEPWARR